jgi:hypothetical protein
MAPRSTPLSALGQATGPISAATAATADTAVPQGNSRCTRCQRAGQNFLPGDERDISHPLHGWPELARLMAVNIDLQAFPAFTDLNIKSLLYYQAELTMLKDKLQQTEWEDHISEDFDHAQRFARRVDYLLFSRDDRHSSQSRQSRQSRQWDLITQIRNVLNNYCWYISRWMNCVSRDSVT